MRDDQKFSREELKEVPMYFLRLFEGQPECTLLDDVYIADMHLHKETEMVFVLRGQLNVKVKETVFPLCAGELLCVKDNVLHEYLTKQPDTDIIKMKFMKDWLLPPFFQPLEKEEYHQLYNCVFKVKPNKDVRKILLEMLNHDLPRYDNCRLFAKFIELTALLLAKPEMIEVRMSVEMDKQRYMDAVYLYLQKHSHLKLTLKMLADHLGLTESYCSKYIKRNLGITFVEYLNTLRINNAMRLLLYTNSSITEIIDSVGFSSVQTFNRVFKSQTGRSPSEYRKWRRARLLSTKKAQGNE